MPKRSRSGRRGRPVHPVRRAHRNAGRRFRILRSGKTSRSEDRPVPPPGSGRLASNACSILYAECVLDQEKNETQPDVISFAFASDRPLREPRQASRHRLGPAPMFTTIRIRPRWMTLLRSSRSCPTVLSAVLGLAAMIPVAGAQTTVTSRVTLAATGIGDQDDMCIWVHPSDRSQSTVITSDKGANKLFVYDLAGNTLQTLPTPGKPGNIDVRYGFLLAGHPVDIVVCNDRTNLTLLVYTVDPATRLLARVDTGGIGTGNNYGSCLYHSLRTGAYYAFTAATMGEIHQFQLSDQADRVGGTLVRSWNIGTQTEACVCDDETGFAYFAEEQVGIWKIGAEPTDFTSGTLIAAEGDASGLTADVEGLASYYAAGRGGYVLASIQGNTTFKV